MREFVRITGNGEDYYMEIDAGSGYYEGEPLMKEEVMEMLLEDAIEKEVDVNFDRVRSVISRNMGVDDQETVLNYLEHLEALAESVS
ncbi:hypothetical protein [Salimicrobium flavidum]|uniref:Uncharacterized protein n=1 Tax=Salimicrobium flavidum TaxID=570947 RepID=A0A1N7IWW2_9BACI|nr:hypothetical protein [Salimicrobium flavidum]SIS41476.1 hypothetical protein SAMN05421687_102368 [Salimicrobium flavidum]